MVLSNLEMTVPGEYCFKSVTPCPSIFCCHVKVGVDVQVGVSEKYTCTNKVKKRNCKRVQITVPRHLFELDVKTYQKTKNIRCDLILPTWDAVEAIVF